MTSLNITEGCTVRLRNGEIAGPLSATENGAWKSGSSAWDEKGEFLNCINSRFDIVEVIEERKSPFGLPDLKIFMPAVQPPKQSIVAPACFRSRKIYLSGPMQGLPEHNVPAFNRAAETLRALGHEVMNPGEHQNEARRDLKPVFLSYCEYIIHRADMLVILPGWENSKGVAAEKALAEVFNLEIRYL